MYFQKTKIELEGLSYAYNSKEENPDRFIVTEEVLDDWLAQNVGLDLEHIPCSKPPFLPVRFIREKDI